MTLGLVLGDSFRYFLKFDRMKIKGSGVDGERPDILRLEGLLTGPEFEVILQVEIDLAIVDDPKQKSAEGDRLPNFLTHRIAIIVKHLLEQNIFPEKFSLLPNPENQIEKIGNELPQNFIHLLSKFLS